MEPETAAEKQFNDAVDQDPEVIEARYNLEFAKHKLDIAIARACRRVSGETDCPLRDFDPVEIARMQSLLTALDQFDQE